MNRTDIAQEMILDGVIVRDPYQLVMSAQDLQALWADLSREAELAQALRDGCGVLAPLTLMQAQKEAFLVLPGRKGLIVQPGDEPESFAAELERLDLIAVDFPLFTDGRGHSLARTLRDHYGFKGELRAQGDVFEDTVHYLARCGFNAFVPRSGVPPVQLLQGFHTFSESYQAAVDCPNPLFLRRILAQREEMPAPAVFTGNTP